jgi:hypothetical protein
VARFPRNPVPLWLAGMLVWGAISLLVLLRYRAIGGEARELNELWLLMSLLWVQFGCAALFAEWRGKGGRTIQNAWSQDMLRRIAALIKPTML